MKKISKQINNITIDIRPLHYHNVEQAFHSDIEKPIITVTTNEASIITVYPSRKNNKIVYLRETISMQVCKWYTCLKSKVNDI